MISAKERLIIALDFHDVYQAVSLVRHLDDKVQFYKIGHHLLMASGLDYLLQQIRHKHVFLDAKLRDIPSTVAAGIERATERGATFLTVCGFHPSAPIARMEMMARGVMAPSRLLSVPSLTSESTNSIDTVLAAAVNGYAGAVVGVNALVSLSAVKVRHPDFLLVTPGIREIGDARDEHLATARARMAIEMGADYIVVGRPITKSTYPLNPAERILAEMQEAFDKRGE